MIAAVMRLYAMLLHAFDATMFAAASLLSLIERHIRRARHGDTFS